MSARKFYIWDTRQVVGNCGLFWGKNRSGYVCNLDEAGEYSEEEAKEIQSSRGTDIAIPVEEVRARAVTHCRVDNDFFSGHHRDMRERQDAERKSSKKARGA